MSPTRAAQRTEGTQAIGRAAEILMAVARLQWSGATLSVICRATRLSRSTAFRILRSLAEDRLLRYESDTHHYYIGPLAYELGLAARGQSDPVSQWRERVERVARRTGLTAYLVARSDSEAVCLAVEQGQAVIRAVPLAVGQRLPLGVGAGSLAILATLDDAEVERILAANSAALAGHGAVRPTPKVLRERIALARQYGYAFSQDSVAAGVLGVGVVVSQPDSPQQLGLSVSMAATQLGEGERARLAAVIREVAR